MWSTPDPRIKGAFRIVPAPLGGEGKAILSRNESLKNEDVHSKKTACGSDLLRQYEIRYDDLVKEGIAILNDMAPKSFGYDQLRRMINRLENFKDSYLLFIRNYDAPFTNNEAERDLRPCTTKQKISGCFRSWQGVLDYCKIRSFIATAKKRAKNIFDSLASLCFPLPLPAGQ